MKGTDMARHTRKTKSAPGVADLMESFTLPEAAGLAGLPWRTVDYWATTGLVKPTAGSGERGAWRRYSFRDLVALRTAAELRRSGISLQAVRKAVAVLRRESPNADPLSRYALVAVDREVALVKQGQEFAVLTGQGLMRHVLDYSQLVDNLRAELERRRA
jgi:DNA-binding transcriptional MerR regulator